MVEIILIKKASISTHTLVSSLCFLNKKSHISIISSSINHALRRVVKYYASYYEDRT